MRVALVYTNKVRAVGRGAGLIAASVRAEGHHLDFYDTMYVPEAKVVNSIIANKPDAVLFSSLTMGFPEAVRIARAVKSEMAVTTLIGGLHVTIMAPEVIREHPEFDYACVGEGESVVPEFLRRLGSGDVETIDNLVFLRDGHLVVNPIRPPEDLSGLPPFPWDLFPRKSIVNANGWLPVTASRGCPFRCAYCCNDSYLNLYGKSYLRYRPTQDVLDEIAMLKEKWKPLMFYFEDEMLFFDRNRVVDLCRGLATLGVNYGAMARVEYLTPEIVELLAETGCRYIAIGVECGDENFRRDVLNRKMGNEAIEVAVRMLKAAGIYVWTLNMIGYPVEYDDELTEATIQFNKRIAPDGAQFTIFYPFPGTKLHQYVVERDLIDTAKAKEAFNYYDDSVLEGVSYGKYRREIQRQFFTPMTRLKMQKALSDGSFHSKVELVRATIACCARYASGRW